MTGTTDDGGREEAVAADLGWLRTLWHQAFSPRLAGWKDEELSEPVYSGPGRRSGRQFQIVPRSTHGDEAVPAETKSHALDGFVIEA